MYECLSVDFYLLQEVTLLIHRHRVKQLRAKCHRVKPHRVKRHRVKRHRVQRQMVKNVTKGNTT